MCGSHHTSDIVHCFLLQKKKKTKWKSIYAAVQQTVWSGKWNWKKLKEEEEQTTKGKHDARMNAKNIRIQINKTG